MGGFRQRLILGVYVNWVLCAGYPPFWVTGGAVQR